MSATTANVGWGATFVGTTNFTSSSSITNITLPSFTVDDLDVTDMGTDGWKEYIAGLKDAGELGVEFQYSKALYDEAIGALGDSDTYTITFSDSSTLEVDGYVKDVSGDNPVDGIVTFTISIKVSGAPTFSPAV